MYRQGSLVTIAFTWTALAASGCVYGRFELGESSGGTTPTGGRANMSSTSIAGPSAGRTGTTRPIVEGGTASTDDNPARGGAVAKGGTTSTGGAIAKGATTSSGGAVAKGGTTSKGGTAAIGGGVSTVKSTGGATSTGGAMLTGATTSMGGATSVATSGFAGAAGAVSSGGTAATGGLVTAAGTGSLGGIGSSAGSAPTAGTAAIAGAPTMVPPSCRHLTADCLGGNCCESINVAPGSYLRGRSQIQDVGDYYESTADWDIPEHVAQVTHAFTLDKFEVTVGRFRAFVQDYDSWHGASNPKVGSGAHPALPGTGWKQIWSDDTTHIPVDAATLVAQLHCDTTATFTDSPNTLSDNLPINCVTWYVAASFCIWDGGRLPTETEWEYVAANGSSNHLYPWGNVAPSVLTANCADTNYVPLLPVGSKPAGAGALGHLDLVGAVGEWVFDSFSLIVYQTFATTPCVDCYFTSEGGLNGGTLPNNVLRGGCWFAAASAAHSTQRGARGRSSSYPSGGMRCARPAAP